MKTPSAMPRKIVGKLKVLIVLILAVIIGIVIGKHLNLIMPSDSAPTEAQDAPQIWTCSMHPQIQLPKQGLCPICNMDLIPLSADESDSATNPRQLSVSENAKKLMDVEVAVVERKFVNATVRMFGKVEYDETTLAYITAWVPGRLDKLYVDYTGVPVNKGDHMVYLYSPDLINAQQELLQTIEAVRNIQNTEFDVMREMTESTADSAREKLKLLGLTDQQISDIETTGKVTDHVTIYSPASGIVIHKNALEGMYVQTGTKIYTIADLSKLWIQLDAYESDLEWLCYGQEVEFTTVSYPGHIFKGTISFIDPILNDKTRTVKVRVNVPNVDGMLKPGMFVKAVVHAEIAAGGRIMNANLADKWICPMHPEIIKDNADTCDICKMPLVTPETLGYVSNDPLLTEKPLVIPASAALITGKRAIVYVQLANTDKPTYQGREIRLGPKADDYYLVRDGLAEGEIVVVNGSFKIDSALQIKAKPSMMMPKDADHAAMPDAIEETHKGAPIDDTFRQQLDTIFQAYFAMQQALANDNISLAHDAAHQSLDAVNAVEMKLLSGTDHHQWMKHVMPLKSILDQIGSRKNIKQIREDFYLLSQQLIQVAIYWGATGPSSFYRIHCPMAFDNTGADWLQDNDQIRNPYFGKMMLKCGSVKKVIDEKDIWTKKDN